MNYTKFFLALFMALLASCSETNQHKDDTEFDRQAHRGGRGQTCRSDDARRLASPYSR